MNFTNLAALAALSTTLALDFAFLIDGQAHADVRTATIDTAGQMHACSVRDPITGQLLCGMADPLTRVARQRLQEVDHRLPTVAFEPGAAARDQPSQRVTQ